MTSDAPNDIEDGPVAFSELETNLEGLAAFFPPLNDEEKDQADAENSMGPTVEDPSATITWAEQLGLADAPRDPLTRQQLVSLAQSLQMTDVVIAASKQDPDPNVRAFAATLLEPVMHVGAAGEYVEGVA